MNRETFNLALYDTVHIDEAFGSNTNTDAEAHLAAGHVGCIWQAIQDGNSKDSIDFMYQQYGKLIATAQIKHLEEAAQMEAERQLNPLAEAS